MMRPDSQLSREDAERLFALVHADPHSVLGAHPVVAGGVVVRALRPEAERIELVAEGGGPVEMARVHPGGIFEALLGGHTGIPRYELRVHYPGGQVYSLRDPYSFPPTLGIIDEHLFGEGRHERIYEKLGSHVRKMNDVDGVSFAVWAPQAEG